VGWGKGDLMTNEKIQLNEKDFEEYGLLGEDQPRTGAGSCKV
jgi:hypothetical protein